jgi:hypothetical protein
MIEEHGETGIELNHQTVGDAIQCENWQRFRIMLKGLPTTDKLSLLQGYVEGRAGGTICCTMATRTLQVVNYLNALSRGGLIEPLSNKEKAALVIDEKVVARIKR